MNALTQMITQQLAGNAISQISSRLGADPGTTGKAVSIAVPLLVSALAHNSSTPEGAEALNQAIARDHDGSILDNLGSFLGNTEAANGAGILGHVFGNNQSNVENSLAQNTGLDPSAGGHVQRTGTSGKASRAREEVEIVFDRNKGALYALYGRALRDQPELAGKLVLEFTIAPSGEITMCRVVSSELKDPELEKKIVARVRLIRFKPADVEPLTVSKPIDFFPAA